VKKIDMPMPGAAFAKALIHAGTSDIGVTDAQAE